MSGRYDGAVESTSTVSEAGIPHQADRSHGADAAVPAGRAARGTHDVEAEARIVGGASDALLDSPARADAEAKDGTPDAASASATAASRLLPAPSRPTDEPALGADTPDVPAEPRTKRSRRNGPRWQMTVAVAWFAGLSTLIVLGHRLLPNLGGLGSLLDTSMPWWCLPIAVLLVWALLLRKGLAVGMALLAVLAWGATDGRALLPRGTGGVPDLRIVSQDVSIDDPDLGAIRALVAQRHADVLALQDLPASVASAPSVLDQAYRYHVGMYEFGVWSRFPITSAKVASFATGTGVTAVRVVISTPHGAVALYDVHLPVPSLSEHGFAQQRDDALKALASTLRAEPLAHYAIVGDLDTAPTDRAMRVFGSGGLDLTSAQASAGSGFGFTWPSRVPLARLDDVLTHGMTALRAAVLRPTGSSAAHRPIEAELRL